MPKTIQCDPYWGVGFIKRVIKETLENYLNVMREQRICNLGENTIYEDLTDNDLQITAGSTFKGLIKIEKGPSGENLVHINYDEKSYLNKSMWETWIENIEEQLIEPL